MTAKVSGGVGQPIGTRPGAVHSPSGRWVLLASFALAPLDGLVVQVGPVGIRAYMVVALFSVFSAATYGWQRRNHVPPTRLLVLLTLVVCLSALWSTSLADTAQVAVGQLFLLLWLLASLRLIRVGVVTVKDLALALLAGCAFSAGVALLQTTLALAGFDWGVWYSWNFPLPRPSGLTREPVWAALNASIGLALATWFMRDKSRAILVAIFSVVLLVTFSRAAILAVAIGIAVTAGILLFRRRSAGPAVAFVVVFGSLASPLVLMLTPPQLLARFDIVGALGAGNASIDQGALASRLGVNSAILDLWIANPLLGHGAGAVATIGRSDYLRQIYAGGGELNTGRGASNFWLTSLYDLGLLGLILSVLLLVTYLRLGWSVRHRSIIPLLIVLIIFLQMAASNGIRLGIVWAALALVAAYAIQSRTVRDPNEV